MKKRKDKKENEEKLQKITSYVPEAARTICRNTLDHIGILDTTLPYLAVVGN